MKVIGLTGGIASGKSTVSRTAQSLGIPVIDCDILARKVVEPGQGAYKKLVARYGTKILVGETLGNPMERPKLGAIIFHDEKERRAVNGIIHPEVAKEVFKALWHHWIRAEPMVIVDVPLLLEGDLWRFMSRVIVVYCPQEVQLERILSRDGLSVEDAQARINAQRPLIEKVEYADHVIYNTSDLETLNQQTVALLRQLQPSSIWTYLNLIPPITLITASWELLRRHMKGDPRKMKLSNKTTADAGGRTPAHAA
ncbi:hypothetical protein DFQ27_004622 [Actinomortierella ambigua]|uniref:Dephospho-CoA kinase n=1 Tax=Actinomortierella ambigua TaxID=1343610 RepID=A0A9P6Q1G1_9FUNG|nr:hypothetical protein DFQ27_004622 [Actinomortierella ambigua]